MSDTSIGSSSRDSKAEHMKGAIASSIAGDKPPEPMAYVLYGSPDVARRELDQARHVLKEIRLRMPDGSPLHHTVKVVEDATDDSEIDHYEFIFTGNPRIIAELFRLLAGENGMIDGRPDAFLASPTNQLIDNLKNTASASGWLDRLLRRDRFIFRNGTMATISRASTVLNGNDGEGQLRLTYATPDRYAISMDVNDMATYTNAALDLIHNPDRIMRFETVARPGRDRSDVGPSDIHGAFYGLARYTGRAPGLSLSELLKPRGGAETGPSPVFEGADKATVAVDVRIAGGLALYISMTGTNGLFHRMPFPLHSGLMLQGTPVRTDNSGIETTWMARSVFGNKVTVDPSEVIELAGEIFIGAHHLAPGPTVGPQGPVAQVPNIMPPPILSGIYTMGIIPIPGL